MQTHSETLRIERLKSFSRFAGIAVSCLSLAVLAGWFLNIAVLKSVLPGFVSMKANTALGTLVAGLALRLLLADPQHKTARITATLFAAFVTLLGILTALEYFGSVDFHIDQLLFSDLEVPNAPYPGRMSPITASLFILNGFTLLLFARSSRWFQALSLVSLTAAVLALLGYAFGVGALYGVGPYTSIAVHTASCFVLLSLGILAAGPALGVAQVIVSDSAGGRIARMLGPSLPIALIVMAVLRFAGEKYGYYGSHFGLAVMVTSNMVVVSALTLWMAAQIHKVDFERQQALDRTLALDEELSSSAKALAMGEKLARLVVDSALEGMVMVNHEGKIVLVNVQTEKLFGYRREDLLGQPVEILLPESSPGSHPAFREDFLSHPQARPMGAGRDLHAQRKDGTRFPVEIGLNPIDTAEGTWVLSSIVDITERKRSEATLRESEERFRKMADTAPVMIWVAGPDKLCTFFNQVWLEFTGRTMEQELGNGWAERVHPDDVDRCVAMYSSSFDARRSFRIDYRLARADGEYRWILDAGVPHFAPDGAFAGYIGSCIDITEVKRSQEEALANQKLESVGLLARGIAHDFNNLLGGILASTELALAEQAQGFAPNEELHTIRTAAIRGGEIVRQLMTYGGEESAAFEPVDVSSLVDEMLQLLKVSISKHAILEIHLDRGLPPVQANPAQIRQIVMNLVTNASEAIGTRDGVIHVTASRVSVGLDGRPTSAANLAPGDYLRLEVADTGDGMTPEVQTRIFDPFFTTKSTGRGLGLAAVRGIVRSHLGAINIVSSVGQGTRFEILLPCAGQTVQPVPGIVTQASDGKLATDNGTILIVEDEGTLRTAASKMLQKKGFSVIEAADGNAAVDLYRANEPDIDVVLLDITLPGISCAEIFAELLRIRPDVKVILTTAYSQEAALAAIGGHQASAFIRKPYLFDDLVTLIRKVSPQKGEMRDRPAYARRL